MKIFKIADNTITLYRGVNVSNKNGHYYSVDKEFARQFTQSGRDFEIITIKMNLSDIYIRDPLPLATDEDSFDQGMKEAKEKGFKAFMLDEGNGLPDSVPNSVYKF